MKIIFAGVGGAFAPMGKGTDKEYGVWQSNILIEKDGKFLAIDMGGDVRHSYSQLPYGLNNMTIGSKVEAVYISHLHGDHANIEWMALMSYFIGTRNGKPRPILYGVDEVLEKGWENVWKGGLSTVENTHEHNLTSFFEVRAISSKKIEPFIWRGISFTPIETLHVLSGTKFQPSYGLLIQEGTGKKVFLTTDTQFCPRQLPLFYNWADIIFHDCETLPWEYRSNVHAHYNDLKTLDKETKAKMFLYHYQPNPPIEDAAKEGFAGFVYRGQEFEV